MLRAATSARHRCATSIKGCVLIQALPHRDSKENHDRQVAEDKGGARGFVLAELRIASDCGSAVHVTVVPHDDYRVGATCEVASCNPGTSAPEACERALCDIVRRLQQHCDIAPT
jgi:hypothetical protein